MLHLIILDKDRFLVCMLWNTLKDLLGMSGCAIFGG